MLQELAGLRTFGEKLYRSFAAVLLTANWRALLPFCALQCEQGISVYAQSEAWNCQTKLQIFNHELPLVPFLRFLEIPHWSYHPL